jgi:uncharacterized protein
MTENSPDIDTDELPEDLLALDDALMVLGDDVMSLSQLDGLLCAVSACPEAIPPEEWLPLIWIEEDVDDEALLADPQVGEVVAKILMRQMDLATQFAESAGPFHPVYVVDDRSSEILWEIWLEGFEQGMSLRPDAWAAVHARGGEAAEAFDLLTTLIFLAEDDAETKAELGPERSEALMSVASEVIPECIEVIVRSARADPRQPVRSAKIGRNEPCPCGSGKKFKKCCAAV